MLQSLFGSRPRSPLGNPVRWVLGCTKSTLLIAFVFMISPIHAERAASVAVRPGDPTVTGSIVKNPPRPPAPPPSQRVGG